MYLSDVMLYFSQLKSETNNNSEGRGLARAGGRGGGIYGADDDDAAAAAGFRSLSPCSHS